MAKVGEGDARWIVADRADGTNVKGWHWVEKDALPWSKERLSSLLGGVELATSDAATVRTTTLLSCIGEAYVNRRKGKIIPGYELEVKLGWEGTAGGQSAKGLVHIPYLADENAGDVGESLEVRVSAEGDGPADRACREAAKQALPLLRSRVAIWVAEMAAGGPGGAGPAAGDGAAAPAAAAAGADDGEPAKAKPGAAAAAAAAPAAEDERRAGGGGQTVRLTERYFCRPADVFEALTSESRVRAYAGGDAAVSPLPGAPFSLFGGGVSGVNLAGMAAGARVEQRWRARDWPDGVFSHVLITLSEPEHGTTVLQLVQTGVPAENRFGHPTETAQGWKQARARLRRSAAGSERRPAAKAAATGDRQ